MTRRRAEYRAEPPRVAEALLAGFVTDDGVREAMLGDLAEEFAAVSDRAGAPSAVVWYWRQTVGSLPRLAHAALAPSPRAVFAWAVATYVLTAAGFLATNACLTYVVLPRVLAPQSRAFCVVFAVLSLCGVLAVSGTLTYARFRRAHRAPFAEAVANCLIWALIGGAWIGAGLGSSPLWYRTSIHLAGITAAALSAVCAYRSMSKQS